MPVSFETLKQLAREPSPDKRRELVLAIATTFFAAPRRSPTELDLFDEIMDQVLAEVEPLARQELSERLADLDDAPRRTLRRLAGDHVIEVAAPVLSRSPALTDDDLEPIARLHGQSHLLAIARRKTLSERVTDILVERGDDHVASAVTANEGARFSDAGFHWLAVRASANETILNHLVMRGDLPERIADELVPELASSIAARIDTASPENEKISTRRLVDDARLLLADRLRAAVSRSRPVAILNQQVERGNMTVGEAAIELADADELVGLGAFIGTRLGLRSDTVVRNLFGTSEATLMLICRAAALNLEAFSAILRMRSRRHRGTVADPSRLMKDYLRIPRPMAENVMRFVREKELAAKPPVIIAAHSEHHAGMAE
jgi:uncharacterized protein (DUF2336 family)